MSVLLTLLNNRFVWFVLGCVVCELVHYWHEQWYRSCTYWWGELIVECAKKSYASTEKYSSESQYYKLGEFMYKFALLWRIHTGTPPAPEEQAAATMVAAMLAEHNE